MTHSNNSYQIVFDLNNYLNDNVYFETEEETIANQKIIDLWDTKFKSAIVKDIKSKFNNVEVDFVKSVFELSSEDNQGACLYFQEIIINDKKHSEYLKAFVKTIVNHNKINIYLDSIYATSNSWEGKSEQLKKVFDKLKTADEKFGYFNPISLTDLVK